MNRKIKTEIRGMLNYFDLFENWINQKLEMIIGPYLAGVNKEFVVL